MQKQTHSKFTNKVLDIHKYGTHHAQNMHKSHTTSAENTHTHTHNKFIER